MSSVPPIAESPKAKPAVPSTALGVTRGLSADDKRIKDAIVRAQARQFSRAERLLKASDPPAARLLVDWIRLNDRRTQPSFAELAAFVTGYPRWPGQTRLIEKAEKALVAESDAGLGDNIIRHWFEGQSPVTSPGGRLYAEVLTRAGKKQDAIAVARKSWIELDFSAKEEKAFRQQFARFFTADDEWSRLDRLLLEKKERSAKRQAKRLGKGYEQLAKARLALAFSRSGVDWAINQVPNHLRNDPGLIYERARWRWKRRRYEGVLELLPQLPNDADWRERSWAIREWATRTALRKDDPRRAYQLARNHGVEGGLGLAEGEWLAGWTALKELNEPEKAYGHFAALYEGVRSPVSRARGAYWAGEAAHAMGRQDWAQGWYALGAELGSAFYGQLSAQRLDRPATINDLSKTPLPEAQERAFFESEIAQAVQILERLGQRKLQDRFLHALRLSSETAEDYRLTMDLASRTGRPNVALRTAKTARKYGFVLADHLFPELPLTGGPEPEEALVLGVIRQESEFNQIAVSPAGARGLMQLMPATARRVARQVRVGYSRSLLTEDPDYNIALGRHYLSGLIDRFDGSYILALAGYNAGPARSDRWMRKHGDPRKASVDPIEWIERIPFEETRNYVQRVLEGMTIYRSRRPSASAEASWHLKPKDPAS